MPIDIEHPGRNLPHPDDADAPHAATRLGTGRSLQHLMDANQLPRPRMPEVGDRRLGDSVSTMGLVSWVSTIAAVCIPQSAT
jgi:hypothetical protein